PTDSPAPIPWELMRDPLTGATLSTKSHSFVRRLAADVGNASGAANAPEAAAPLETPLRILLVSCQPSVAADPPFRSAARLLVQRLAGQAPSSLVLDILRPPTFGQLTSVLLEAEALGEPYHAVHFDGHAV